MSIWCRVNIGSAEELWLLCCLITLVESNVQAKVSYIDLVWSFFGRSCCIDSMNNLIG